MKSREEYLNSLQSLQSFRRNQINDLLFDVSKTSFEEASNLPKDLVVGLKDNCKFYSIEPVKILKSKLDGTYKGLFKDLEGNLFESVLMENSKGNFSICVSSQIGCAMG